METLHTLGVWLWIGSAILGGAIGARRNAGPRGFVAGLFFGPLGMIAAFGFDDRLQCPRCHGRLNGKPPLCPYCQSSLEEHWRQWGRTPKSASEETIKTAARNLGRYLGGHH